MEHFKDTHHIREDGRYMVKLPRVANPPKQRNSKQMAEKRFHQNEHCLLRKGLLESFTGSVDLGHAEPLPKEMIQNLKFPVYHHQDESCFRCLCQNLHRCCAE